MRDFTYYAPTQVEFGKNAENKTGELVKYYGGTNVLVHYGGGSVVRSGLLDIVCKSLEEQNIKYTLLGGVVPNPRVSLVREGIEICRKENIDFIVAVGGGSTIDSSKAIAAGTHYEGDVWTLYRHEDRIKRAIPVGVVLTIPAAGSEMSDASVITNEDGGLKKDYCDSLLRPKFAIMNPERTFTLPEWQTACGATDIMMHTMERYFSNDDDMEVTNVVAEAILKIVMEHAPIVLAEPENYHSRAQIMWAGSLAHNDLTGCGNGGDWATHNIEHELSGMFDVSHGAGLAAIWPSWARYTRHQNINRFARFAVNVMGVTNHFESAEETAEAGILAMEKFYTSIGMPINIKQLVGRNVTDAEIEEMADKCTNGNTMTVGGLVKLTKEDIINIYKLANK